MTGTLADEMEQEREGSIWLSSWVEMNFKQGRVGKRFLKMVKTWNGAGSTSHDAEEITERWAGKSCMRTLKYI